MVMSSTYFHTCEVAKAEVVVNERTGCHFCGAKRRPFRVEQDVSEVYQERKDNGIESDSIFDVDYRVVQDEEPTAETGQGEDEPKDDLDEALRKFEQGEIEA